MQFAQTDHDELVKHVSEKLTERHVRQLADLVGQHRVEIANEVARQIEMLMLSRTPAVTLSSPAPQSTVLNISSPSQKSQKKSTPVLHYQSPPTNAWCSGNDLHLLERRWSSNPNARLLALHRSDVISLPPGFSLHDLVPTRGEVVQSDHSTPDSTCPTTPSTASTTPDPGAHSLRRIVTRSSPPFGSFESSDRANHIKSMKDNMKRVKQSFIKAILPLAKKSSIYVNMFQSSFSQNGACINIRPEGNKSKNWDFNLTIDVKSSRDAKVKLIIDGLASPISQYDSRLERLQEPLEVERICVNLWNDIMNRMSLGNDGELDDGASWDTDSDEH